MVEENISQKFRLEYIDETRNYFLEETKQHELVSRKHKRVSTTLNYIENFLTLTSTIFGCISIFAFASFLSILIGITSSAIGLKICAITAGTKKCKLIINKNRKNHYKIVLQEKSKLNNIEVLILKLSSIQILVMMNVF